MSATIATFLNEVAALRAGEIAGAGGGMASVGLEHFLARVRDLSEKSETAAVVQPASALTQARGESLKPFLASLRPLYEQFLLESDAVDPWALTGVGRDELRNARVLSWLLNSNGSHRASDALLKRWISTLYARAPRQWLAPAVWRGDIDILVEYYPMADAESRVDLALLTDDAVVFVEVKVDAGEGEDQLGRYQRLAEHQARSRGHQGWGVIYLTPRLEADTEDSDGLVRATWRELSRVLYAEASSARNNFAQHLIRSFARHVRSF